MKKSYSSLVLLFAIASCSIPPSATSSGPRTLVLDGKSISEDAAGGFTCWYCKDFINEGPIVLEVGHFGAPSPNEVGFILYDGGYSGKIVAYQRTGLEHRWDFGDEGDESANYSFIIKTDGIGAYFDFTNLSVGEQTKPKDIYKCYQRK